MNEKPTKIRATKKGPPTIGTVEYTGHVVGRKKVVVKPEDVKKLAQLGCFDVDICEFFGIDADTLTFNFKDQLLDGRAEMRNRLRRAMIENACVRLNPAIQIFLAKNWLGMRDTPLEVENNKPLPWNDDF